MSEILNLDFNEEEVVTLKSIIQRDALLKGLVEAQQGLSALNSILKIVTPGPAKIVLQWNTGLFIGWAKANSKLGAIIKETICQDLTLAIAENTKNSAFFERLRLVRGCDD